MASIIASLPNLSSLPSDIYSKGVEEGSNLLASAAAGYRQLVPQAPAEEQTGKDQAEERPNPADSNEDTGRAMNSETENSADADVENATVASGSQENQQEADSSASGGYSNLGSWVRHVSLSAWVPGTSQSSTGASQVPASLEEAILGSLEEVPAQTQTQVDEDHALQTDHVDAPEVDTASHAAVPALSSEVEECADVDDTSAAPNASEGQQQPESTISQQEGPVESMYLANIAGNALASAEMLSAWVPKSLFTGSSSADSDPAQVGNDGSDVCHSSDEDKDARNGAATKIQCVFRCQQARKAVAAELALLFTVLVTERIRERMGKRTEAKAFMAARNRKITVLRKELASYGVVNWYANMSRRQEIQDALHSHMFNTRHITRAALLIQGWWRGMCQRGWPNRGCAKPLKLLDDKSSRSTLLGRARDSLSSINPFAQVEGCYPSTAVKKYEPDPSARTVPAGVKRILILYSDTGGGHRASAISLSGAFRFILGDNVVVDKSDVADHTGWPWSNAGDLYRFLAARPSFWSAAYNYDSNKKSMLDTDLYQILLRTTRERLLSFFVNQLHEGLDLVISVHPLLNHIPYQVLEEIGDGKPIVPLVTVVTDLGSAHLSWFDPRVTQLYVPSDALEKLALEEFDIPENRLYKYGLPVREAFWSEDTTSKAQRQEQLGLPGSDRSQIALVMGGGEGFGALDQIAIAIGKKMCETGHGQMVVVCGRNQHTKDLLDAHAWPSPDFKPVILGFVNNVDEYMTAADCIVTKAGPGTIAEAMTRGLPCLLTSYLPGQEEGNVAFVADGGVGEYVSDVDPLAIAETLAAWFSDDAKMKDMSERAKKLGRGQATIDIARQITTSLLQEGDSEDQLRY